MGGGGAAIAWAERPMPKKLQRGKVSAVATRWKVWVGHAQIHFATMGVDELEQSDAENAQAKTLRELAKLGKAIGGSRVDSTLPPAFHANS